MMAVTDMGSGYEDRGICGTPWVRWRGYFIHTLPFLATNIHDIHIGNCYRLSIALPLIIGTMGLFFLNTKDLLCKRQSIIIIKAYLHWAKANAARWLISKFNVLIYPAIDDANFKGLFTPSNYAMFTLTLKGGAFDSKAPPVNVMVTVA